MSAKWSLSPRRTNPIGSNASRRSPLGLAKILCTVAALSLLWCPQDSSLASDPRIVFTSTRDGFERQIYVMDADASSIRRLTSLAGYASNPHFSADNRRIAFSFFEPNSSSSQVYIMNADGSQIKALTSQPGLTTFEQFIPGDRIVYWHEVNPGSSIMARHVMDIDGSRQAPLPLNAPGLGAVGPAAYGPHALVAFTSRLLASGDETAARLYTITVDGRNLRRLTSSTESVAYPAWSPDGTKIAYANIGVFPLPDQNLPRSHQNDGIYLIDSDGRNAALVVPIHFGQDVGPSGGFGAGPARQETGPCSAPSFSPDRTRLTYAVALPKCQIYIVNVNGTGLRRLTGEPGSSSEPSFSH